MVREGYVREISGTNGLVRHGYQAAVTLDEWRMVPHDRGYAVTGRASWLSDHWIAQRPLTLALDVGRNRWSWTDVEPSVQGTEVRVILVGRPHVEHGAADLQGQGRG